jgi:hypothetical protein
MELEIGDNYRIYPGDVSQSEVFIVKHPSDNEILFSTANTLVFNPFFVSEGIYVTTNGGNTWAGNNTCTGEPITFHGGDPGITITKDGTFILTRLSSFTSGLFSHYSTDNGQTWSQQKTISTEDLERAAITSDVTTTSNFYGRTYAVWAQLTTPFSFWFSFTDDGAKNWSSTIQINNPSLRSAGGDIAIGTNGEVYACWAGLNSVSPFNAELVGFASSSNGGANWAVIENAFNVNGISGLLTNKGNIRVNGLPGIAIDTTNGPRRDWIYIVTGQEDLLPAGNDPDIILNRSTDGGQTWSAGIRVNQDELNNGKTQYFPSVHVDKFGAINIIFYDDRNTSIDSSGVFLARSTDGGNNWTEFEISDHNYKPLPIGGLGQGYQGDNIDITSTDSKLWPVWMDNSTGVYQLWTVPVEFSAVSVENVSTSLHSFELKQNYPNPFNPSTNIEYSIYIQDHVLLKVFDVSGKVVQTLVNEVQSAGNYKVKFEINKGNDFASGIYFYTLATGNTVLTKAMLLLK